MDTEANTRTLADEFAELIHPADEADLPTPGPNDPRFAALIAWARSQPIEELGPVLEAVLAFDDLPQQDLAMALLRKFGTTCDGEGFGEDFRWVLRTLDGRETAIEPRVKQPGDSRESADYNRYVLVELDERTARWLGDLSSVLGRDRGHLAAQLLSEYPRSVSSDPFAEPWSVLKEVARQNQELRQTSASRRWWAYRASLARVAESQARVTELLVFDFSRLAVHERAMGALASRYWSEEVAARLNDSTGDADWAYKHWLNLLALHYLASARDEIAHRQT